MEKTAVELPSPQGLPNVAAQTIIAAINAPARRAILAELAKGEPAGIADLSQILKLNIATARLHVDVLDAAGIIVRGRGRLYHIAPAYQPVPGQRHLDFGHCILRLDYGATPA